MSKRTCVACCFEIFDIDTQYLETFIDFQLNNLLTSEEWYFHSTTPSTLRNYFPELEEQCLEISQFYKIEIQEPQNRRLKTLKRQELPDWPLELVIEHFTYHDR
jgi:hypothetical protein